MLAIVAAFVAIPSLNVALLLDALWLIASLAYAGEEAVRLFLVALVLPAVGAALSVVLAIGAQLGALASNIALAATGVATTVIVRRLIDNAKGDVASLTGK